MYHSLMIILIKDLDIFEVFNKIKEFKTLIKNLFERNIKILRSDNGGEYTSKEFVSFCRDVGIKRELTTPYNYQQNGVVERKNRTMLEDVKIKIFLCAYGQKQLWQLLMCRLSHSALGFNTPEEMFTGKKPEVSHLKYLAVQCLFIYRKRKGTNWSPLERREYLWDTMRYPRPSESTYLVTATLKSTGT
jgi:transposase InsO family protein